MIPVYTAANEFIRRNTPNLTPMKLQKLIYLADKQYGELVDEPFDIWETGPVIISLWRALKFYKASIIPEQLFWVYKRNGKYHAYTPILNKDDVTESKCIQSVINKFGHMSGPELSNYIFKHMNPDEVTNRFNHLESEDVANIRNHILKLKMN